MRFFKDIYRLGKTYVNNSQRKDPCDQFVKSWRIGFSYTVSGMRCASASEQMPIRNNITHLVVRKPDITIYAVGQVLGRQLRERPVSALKLGLHRVYESVPVSQCMAIPSV